MADGHIKIVTRLDNDEIKADLKELESLVANGGENITEQFAYEVEKLSAKWAKLEAQQSKNNAKITEYKSEMAELQRLMNLDVAAGLNAEPLQLSSYEKIAQDLKEAEAKAQNFNVAMSKASMEVKDLNGKLKGSDSATKELDKSAKSVNKTMSQTPKHATKVSGELNKGFKTLTKYAGMLLGVRAIYSGVQKATSAWMQTTKEGAQAQADLQGIWQSLGQTLAPVIQWLISLLQQLLGYANALTKAFFGFELFSKSAAKNLGGAVKQAKELRKQLAGFDEMNILGSNGQQNAAGATAIKPTEIGTPDISGFKKSIDQLKKWLDDLWNNDTVQSYWNSIRTITMNSINSLMSLTKNIWDNVVLSWNEMLPFLNIGFSNMLEYWRRILEDVSNISTEWFPKITNRINSFVDSIFKTFRPLTTFISQVWSDFTKIMLDLWNEYGAPILNEVMKFIDGLIDTFHKIWTHIIDPILTPAIEMMKKLWDEHIKDILYKLGDFVGNAILKALEFYNEFIKPLVDWLVVTLGPVFSTVFGAIFNVVGTVMGNILSAVSGTIDSMKQIFNGILSFLGGAFTGDWKRTWQGISDIFGGVFNGLKSIFRAPINWIIDKLNSFIRGVNKIKIPSWVPMVGGKGITIPTLPMLAKGGIVTKATGAIIGEDGREAVIPLKNNTGWAKDFLGVLDSYGGGFGGKSQPIINIFQVDGEEVARFVKTNDKDEEYRTNGGPAYGY